MIQENVQILSVQITRKFICFLPPPFLKFAKIPKNFPKKVCHPICHEKPFQRKDPFILWRPPYF